ncbi:hypothetical protein H0H93_002140 [Arthromyces matolae]|nr:hypothetical protein H0H93_002140 [Arthromyces matolae]
MESIALTSFGLLLNYTRTMNTSVLGTSNIIMAIGYGQKQASLTLPALKHVQAKLRDLLITPISPIQTLPTHVLAKIFLSKHQDYAYDRWEVHAPHDGSLPRISLCDDSSLDPMLLAQVCTQWRQTALTTPLLWSSINILCSDKKQRVPLLKAWLEHSGNTPLCISFTESTSGFIASAERPDALPYSPLSEEIISLLVEQAFRWKKIDFTFARQIPAALADGLSLGSVPLLEEASIASRDATCETFGGLTSLRKVWEALHSSPSLLSGKWELEYLESHFDSIPWAQLTSADVTMSLEFLMIILPLCVNLKELRYTDPLVAYHPDNLSPCVQVQDEGCLESIEKTILPELQHLTLKMYEPVDAILDRLTLPKLRSYDVQVSQDNSERPHVASLKDLLARSECRLEDLTFDSSDTDAEATMVKILSLPQLSSLSSLEVKRPTTDVLVDALKRTSDSRNLLPNLESLYLGACRTRNGGLSEMILSRQSVVDDLASLTIFEVGRWECHTTDMMCFEVLAEEGVCIKASFD